MALYALLALTLSWRAALLIGPARVAGSEAGHWFIGYRTHSQSPQRHRMQGAAEEGRNSTLLGWISFGEGFHNNHHAIPDSARMGQTRCEFDLGWLRVQALERLGLATGVKSWCRGNAPPRPGATLLTPWTRTPSATSRGVCSPSVSRASS